MNCPCGRKYSSHHEALLDDNKFACFRRIGRSTLICGKKNSHFPFQLFVGPDWNCMCVTYILIVVPTVLFIRNVATYWGAALIVPTVFLMLAVLTLYSYTACSNPGIVLLPEQASTQEGDSESAGPHHALQWDEERGHPVDSSQESQNMQQHSLNNMIVDNNEDDVEDENDMGGMEEGDQRNSDASKSSDNDSNRASTNSDGSTKELTNHAAGPPLSPAMANRSKPSNKIKQNSSSKKLRVTTGASPLSVSSSGAKTAAPTSAVITTANVHQPISYNSRSSHTANRSMNANTSYTINGNRGLASLPGTVECGMCNIDRPRNASHCHDCGVCVQGLDHHCPWTGKCIGERTINSFYAFLWALSALIALVILMVIVTAAHGVNVFIFT